jgi:hypothetical protein
MDPKLQAETEAAGREILAHLEVHGETPVLDLKDKLGIPEVVFYFGLGDLILKHRVGLRRHDEVFWAILRPALAEAA